MCTVPYFHVRSSCASSYYKWGRFILVSIVPRSWTLRCIVSGMEGGGGKYFPLIFPRPSLNAIHPDTLSLVTSKTEMDACS